MGKQTAEEISNFGDWRQTTLALQTQNKEFTVAFLFQKKAWVQFIFMTKNRNVGIVDYKNQK